MKDKDIDVSFLGQINSYRSNRVNYIKELKKLNANVFLSTEFNNKMLTFEEYADILNRSKISLNFSYSVHCHQLKGRVLEILSSEALLLETENDQTNKNFECQKEYINFSNYEDMIKKIKFYLKNDQLRLKIAKQGRKKLLQYNEKNNFWDQLFNKLDIKSFKKASL